jgi:uncharacterized Zn-binding protein involved in type VI secretion
MPPAARVTDMHVCPMVTPGVPPIPHVGGPILPPGAPTVLIGFLPAATATGMAVCVGPPDLIAMGSAGVFINFLPAARMGDTCGHGGTIVLGEPTVMIGEIGSPAPGAGGMGSVMAGLVAAGLASVVATGSYSATLATPGTQGTPPPVFVPPTYTPLAGPSPDSPADSSPAPVADPNPDPTPPAVLSPDALLSTTLVGLTPVAVLPGTNGIVAVIGRSMGNPTNPGVTAYGAALGGLTPAVEIFDVPVVSNEAMDEFKEAAAVAKKAFDAGLRAQKYLTDDELKLTKLYKENVAWAQKLKQEGYTVADLGNPQNLGESAFYNAEKAALASPDWIRKALP